MLKTAPVQFMVGGFPLLEFDRRPFDPWPVGGFALEWTADLTLVHLLDTEFFRLNGYVVLRHSDMRGWRPIPENDFLARVVRLKRVHPVKPGAIKIGSMKAAIRSSGAAYPLITLHLERLKRNVCYIGKYIRVSQRAVTIRAISPQAEWEHDKSYLFKDITCLEFGGEYENLLQRIAKK